MKYTLLLPVYAALLVKISSWSYTRGSAELITSERTNTVQLLVKIIVRCTTALQSRFLAVDILETVGKYLSYIRCKFLF